MFCPNCGSKLDEDAQFCGSCGGKINIEDSSGEPEQNKSHLENPSTSIKKPTTKAKKITLIWGVIFFVIAFFIARAAFDPNTPSAFTSSFIPACENKSAEATPAYCSCAANYLVSNYNETQLQNLETRVEAGDNSPPELEAATVACTSDSDYQKNFMMSCTSSGGTDSSCGCALAYLTENYTLEERIQMDYSYQASKQLPLGMINAIKSCASAAP
jgi:uncharacterized membrane protein YvbJ